MHFLHLFVRCMSVFAMLTLSQSIITAQEDVVPPPMPMLDEGNYDVTHFLLLGSDTANPNNIGRTDALMVVSVNRTSGTVSFLSIPRDLYVYIPGHGMNRINTAFGFGEGDEQVEGGGAELLKETIAYNLGIEIDYFARINFASFRALIDDLGGIDVAVDCAIQDWRLREPDLDPTLEENWIMFTLPVGMHHMDGDLALWYARSRRTSSDFDRGRRQQVIMRAIWQRVRALNLYDQLRDIYPQVAESVTTDIELDDLIGLVPLATTIDASRIAAYTFRANIEVTFFTSPEGMSVVRPVPEAIMALAQQMITPPNESELVREHANIEIVNASGVRGFAQVAAERLAWEGFLPTLSSDSVPYRDYTVIYDYTGQRKGSSLSTLQRILRVSDEGVIIEPDPNRTVDFRVIIGGNYYSCTHNVLPPTEEAPENTGG